MNKQTLQSFLLKARSQTYAAGTSKTTALLPGSVQYEYADGDFSYRDVYYLGNDIFPGLEVVFYKGEPVWSMSYCGNYQGMTEEQADTMLRQALIDLWETTRMATRVEKDFGDFRYVCDGQGTIDELSGTEEISVDGQRVYFFYYAGGYIGQQDIKN